MSMMRQQRFEYMCYMKYEASAVFCSQGAMGFPGMLGQKASKAQTSRSLFSVFLGVQHLTR